MKKLLLILLLSTLTACSSNPTESGDAYLVRASDGSLYGSNDIGMPHKISALTARTTPLCDDPLCMHSDGECPLFDCSGGVQSGNLFFYRRGRLTRGTDGYTGKLELRVFDITSSESRSLGEYSDSIVLSGAYENYLYFYLAEWENDGELTCRYKLMRADADSGKVIELESSGDYSTVGGFTSTEDMPNFQFGLGERIYWTLFSDDNQSPLRVYSTDLAGENRREHGKLSSIGSDFAGDYSYSAGVTYDSEMKNKAYFLSRRKIPTDGDFPEPEMLSAVPDSSDFAATERYVYYLKIGASTPGDRGVSTLSDCTLMRFSPGDESEPTEVCSLSGYEFDSGDFRRLVFVGTITDGERELVVLSPKGDKSLVLIIDGESGEIRESVVDLSDRGTEVVEFEVKFDK